MWIPSNEEFLEDDGIVLGGMVTCVLGWYEICDRQVPLQNVENDAQKYNNDHVDVGGFGYTNGN